MRLLLGVRLRGPSGRSSLKMVEYKEIKGVLFVGVSAGAFFALAEAGGILPGGRRPL